MEPGSEDAAETTEPGKQLTRCSRGRRNQRRRLNPSLGRPGHGEGMSRKGGAYWIDVIEPTQANYRSEIGGFV